VAGRIQNLKPWPKGVSGNPKGRPKDDISAELARAVFENNAEAIYYAMARRLIKGDVRAFKILADRAYGKVKERVEPEFTPAELVERFEAARQRMLAGMSDEEINDEIRQLETRLGMSRVSAKILNSAVETHKMTGELVLPGVAK